MDKLGFEMLRNKNTLKVYSIFFDKWLTLKDASRIFNPNMPKLSRNERVVQYNFAKFNKLNWLDIREEKRSCIRTSKLGKKSKKVYSVKTYRTNYNFFFESKIDTELKDFLLVFLNQNPTRAYLIETYKEDIPSGVEDIVKQLFLISIALKKYGYKKRYNFNLNNYNKVIHEKIQKYYSDILFSKKKGKRFSKLLKKIYPQNSFWFFLELFAIAMIKLFFKEGFATEIAKTSPNLYFWLRSMYGDFTFIY